MVICLLSLLLVAACGIAMRPVLRRAFRFGVVAAGQPIEVVLELPADLQHLPEPPVLPPSPIQILDPPEVFRRLRELELGVSELGQPIPEHDDIVAAAVAAIGDAATQRRYSPRPRGRR